jgi:hypothetical protein
VSEIRLYVEGGGGKDSKARLRQAFSQFLAEPRVAAHTRGMPLRVVMCGSREDAYRDFMRGVRDHADARVLLLVDSERPVTVEPGEHLSTGDGWNLASIADEQCHLMAQVMESWFLADPEALARFYGQKFGAGQIPKRKNVEEVPKEEVMSSLERASRNTQRGPYHKILHGAPILESLSSERVRSRASHCDRLFASLQEAIG